MKWRIVLLVCSVVLLNACATTEVLNVWKQDGESPQKLQKLLVVGVLQEPAYRKIFEQKLVKELQRDGVQAVPTFEQLGVKEKPSEEEARALINEHGADGVLLVRLVDSETKQVYTPGMTVMVSNSYNAGWYGYYGGAYSVYNTPGRTYNYTEVTVETVIFDLASDKPVWSAVTRTTEEKKFEAIESYIKGIHGPLSASGLF